MKKYLILVAIIFNSFLIFAQKVPFEKLEEFSKFVSKQESLCNDLTYTEESNTYKISFSNTSFMVSFANQLATRAIYRELNGVESFYLTESVDLSKATGILYTEPINGLYRIKLYFPTNSLKTKIFINGAEKETIYEDYLEFYSKQTTSKNGKIIFNGFYDLCVDFQKEKGLITQKNIDAEMLDWNSSNYTIFIKKHPNSLLRLQAKEIIRKDDEIAREKRRLQYLEDERQRQIAIEVENEKKEEKRLAEIRDVSFGAFRIGVSTAIDEMATTLPSNVPNPIVSIATPFETGKLGLQSGYCAGFTGIAQFVNLNKKLPSRIGLGIYLDFNFNMLKYSWEKFGASSGETAVLYTKATYSPFYIVSAGIGLSFSTRPIGDHLFIDFFASPDFYMSSGGDYEVNTSIKGNTYNIKVARVNANVGIGIATGVNFRYKHLILGVNWHKKTIDRQELNEYITIERQFSDDYSSNKVTPELNLSSRSFTIGYVF